MDDGSARSVDITYKGFPETIRARCVVASSGGFQANLDWMREYWGDAVDNFVIRGTPYNRGRVLKNLLDQGVGAVGDPTQFHAVALDARAPKFDGGITTRLDSVPYSVVVNRNGERFYDEGEDVWPKRYAIWGRLIAQQPGQIAYSICDTKAFPLFMPSVFPAIKADTLEELAVKMKLDPVKVRGNDRRLQPSGKARAGVRQPETGRQRDRGSDAEQDQLGARGGQAAVLRLPAAPRHHLHLSRRPGERQGAGADGERSARRQPVRIRRDHVGQYPRQGLSRRVRHDDRDRVRPHRRAGGSASCKKLTPSKTLGGRWRSATPAVTAKDFARFSRRWNCVASSHAGDLSYLANLCHNCRGCYYACQYSPPHAWGINVPKTLAEVRAESYAEYAWPKPLAAMFNRNGTVVSLIAALGIAVVLILSMLLNTPGNFFGAHGTEPGSFYEIIPLWAMQIVGHRDIRLLAGGAVRWGFETSGEMLGRATRLARFRLLSRSGMC